MAEPGVINPSLDDPNYPVGQEAPRSPQDALAKYGGVKALSTRGYLQGPGAKKALFVGINYFGTQNELRGCINDVRNLYNFVKANYNFDPANMMVLTDDNPSPTGKPTRQNILGAINWLLDGAKAGDSLFFHYSGHGGTTRGPSGAMETIIPLDFERAGQITDVELKRNFADKVPAGCQLTAIFDSCHSGTVMNLAFTFVTYPTRSGIMEVDNNSGIGQNIINTNAVWNGSLDQVMAQLEAQGFKFTTHGGRDFITDDAHGLQSAKQYTIQPGDTLWDLAQKGLAPSVDVLMKANPGIVPEMLMPGQVINLSEPTTSREVPVLGAPDNQLTYTIKEGDTYWKLCQEGKAPSVEALIAANPHLKPEALAIGQVINIPHTNDRGFGDLLNSLLGNAAQFFPTQSNYSMPLPPAMNNVTPSKPGNATGNPADAQAAGWKPTTTAIRPDGSKDDDEDQWQIASDNEITKGTIIQFAGCRPEQTSADAYINNKSQGALSWSFLTAMSALRNPTYQELIVKIRSLLAGKYTQVPQLSTGFHMDLDQPFSL